NDPNNPQLQQAAKDADQNYLLAKQKMGGTSDTNTVANAPITGNTGTNTAANGPITGNTGTNTAANGPITGNTGTNTAANGPITGNTGTNTAANGPITGNIGANSFTNSPHVVRHKPQNFKFKTRNVVLPSKPQQNIVSVKFVAGNRIPESQNWKGPKYVVFKTYKSEWHDRGWWQQHHGADIVLVSGGYYYRRGNYWFPAWGYDESAAFYPYDGPIYAFNNLRPDQVVANVQAALQELGYYQDGEVDGLLGPKTREALAQFQMDNQLEATAAIDQPTMESLGMT